MHEDIEALPDVEPRRAGHLHLAEKLRKADAYEDRSSLYTIGEGRRTIVLNT